nr:ankyrin repeat domain-containing protein 34B [Oryctolagus cuniculus]
MEESADVSSEGNSLIKAVHQSRLRLARLLLEGGAYINESNERGETPLMVACKSKHVDARGVSKAKMVRYLLENEADPNIQDKSGKTALMHACLERAGPEVVSLLLRSGADLSLQDHSSCSALVYAIDADDPETLQVLLSACKARGKEVIIITTAKSPCGKLTTKQYLNTPPAGAPRGPGPCASPSEIDLRAACAEDAQDGWDAGSPGRKPALAPASPWSRSPPARMRPSRVASLQEEPQDASPEEELCRRASALALSRRFITRHESIDVKDTAHLLRALEQSGARRVSHEEPRHRAFSAEAHLPPGAQTPADADADADPAQPAFASTLRSVVQKRNSGADHYSSDSQLSAAPAAPASEDGKALAGKRKVLAPETAPPGALGRRHHAALERRGSAAWAPELGVPQPRPGFLPPLPVTPHPPLSEVSASNKMGGLLSCGQRVLVPTVPAFPKEFGSKKMLLRRQSLQTEQIKQLVNF